jgi:hypothetical protein
VRLAGAGAADQHGVALLVEEVAAGEVADQRLVDRRVVEVELLDLLGQRQLGAVIWYLIERACFSLISAFSRSPMICCGSCWRLTGRWR